MKNLTTATADDYSRVAFIKKMKRLILALFIIVFALSMISSSCRRNSTAFTIAQDGKPASLDPIGGAAIDANAERLRTLMFNSLVKKDANFDYVGELAEIKDLDNGSTISFALKDNVKFHDGKILTSADAKFTLDTLFQNDGAKASAFYEGGDKTKPFIVAIEAPDAKTLNLKLSRPQAKNRVLANLVPVAIIPEGSKVGSANPDAGTNPPLGTGPYKFVKFDTAQNIVELTANNDYWEGAPSIKDLRVKTIADANALQAELKSQRVELAPLAINLSPDTLDSLKTDPNLKVEPFEGSNVNYICFNTEVAPFNNLKVRQAVAFAVNREKIIADLLKNQAKIANSILPEKSWAFHAGTTYIFDQAKAKQLLDEAGMKDTNGDGMRDVPPIKFTIAAGNNATRQYVEIIQNQLKEVGLAIEIEPIDLQVMLQQVQKGQYQVTTGRWVGGNQDPIFLRDLYQTDTKPAHTFNRSRYSNKEVDDFLAKAIEETDRTKAKELYSKAQDIISKDVPMLPLWYPSNMVVMNKKVSGLQVNASGDWTFMRNLTFADAVAK